ncbi:N-acetyltransferase [Aliifodinibius sp. S!AR15-10]|uniref:GNAT family N-acetyltransferase n=1 Tax=Aliifodinibius sp. S!AR15-10 TaxID=2950437 RepID=UPI0028576777|nr:N-acetyltransferase [Aliifodinibius sp. S!AR15-10]MDR8393988.1 N-acetyltransferase [Aliifodinibius sp. S!AR15-10]
MSDISIREEEPGDIQAVRAVNKSAFPTAAEAQLVDRLRAELSDYISLVAVSEEQLVGHIFFTPVTISENPDHLKWAGLAPMAVAPDLQRRGIGSKLVRAGMKKAKDQGYDGVVVLGHTEYYPRFGFQPASTFGLHSTFDVPDEAFMVKELAPGALRRISGLVTYHPFFEEL